MHEDIVNSLGGFESRSAAVVVVEVEPPIDVRVVIVEGPTIEVDVELIVAR